MKVLNDLFDYGLKIYQNSDYFKFSIDSILLAEFVKIAPNYKVLDICTGNAPIPLILTTKDKTLEIEGLEIQSDIYELATESVQYNDLTDRITIHNIDAKDFRSAKQYDVVTCNPPYFKVTTSSQKNEEEIKRIARHEVYIDLASVIEIGKNNLKETGTLYLVHRTERLLETINLLEKHKLGIRTLIFVFTKNDAKAEFFLVEASNYKKSDPKVYGVYTKDKTTYKGIFEEVSR